MLPDDRKRVEATFGCFLIGTVVSFFLCRIFEPRVLAALLQLIGLGR